MLRDDIKLNLFATPGGGYIRMAYDKPANSIIYLSSNGELFELDLAATDQTQGKRIGTTRDV